MSQLLCDVISEFKMRKATLAFAESCTGGLLAAELTKFSGVSEFFLGAIVSYSNQCKRDLLLIPEAILNTEGAVSRIVAIRMAQGVRAKLKSDWAVATTGIAGPTGGTEDKPVGTVWIAVSGPSVEVAERCLFTGTRTEIQNQACNRAYQLLLDKMKSN